MYGKFNFPQCDFKLYEPIALTCFKKRMRRHFMRAGKRAMVLNQIHGINTNDKSLKATFKNLIYCNKIKENV